MFIHPHIKNHGEAQESSQSGQLLVAVKMSEFYYSRPWDIILRNEKHNIAQTGLGTEPLKKKTEPGASSYHTGNQDRLGILSMPRAMPIPYTYCQCRNYRTEVEEYEGTVIYRTLLFYNSVFLRRCEKKNVSEFTPNFFRRSIILVGALLFYNYVFPHFSHISHFRSIINVSRAPFYN